MEYYKQREKTKKTDIITAVDRDGTEAGMCIGDLVDNRFDINCDYDIYDCTKETKYWNDGAERIFSTIENGWVNPPDSILKMKILYITLDFNRKTIVIEAGK